jgi:hypothetical protein
MGEVGLQALRQGLSLIAADRRGAERVATDIRPAQDVRVDQHNPADSSLGQSASNGPAHRPAPEEHDGSIQQTRGSGILAPPMHPARIGSLDGTPNDGAGAEIPAEQNRLRCAARPKSLRLRLGDRSGMGG